MVREEVVKQAVESGLEHPRAAFAMRYLDFYYRDATVDGPDLTPELVIKYTKLFQESLGFESNGVLDSQLVKLMEHLPRCGCPDYIRPLPEGTLASKWGTKALTYYIDSYVGGLSQSDVATIINAAWKSWMKVADITLNQTMDKASANMIVSTGRGAASNFDGPGNVLAWAYLPSGNNYNGQLLMRFDLDETWIKDPTTRGIMLLNVAAHEFGHLLGLDHSRQQQALMAPYYNVAISAPQANDDIPRIQALYGQPTAPPPPPPPPPPPGKVKVELTVASLSDILINGKPVSNTSDGGFVLI